MELSGELIAPVSNTMRTSVATTLIPVEAIDQFSLVTSSGAQTGRNSGGTVNLTLKSGTTDPGAEASVTAGSRDYKQSALSYGGRSGSFDYFATGQFLHSGVGIENPAFDVTPAKYITAIITEHGVLRAPYNQSIQQMAVSATPELTTT